MENLIGQRFGKLLVTGIADAIKHRARVQYVCDCGKTGFRRVDQLRTAVSCGCSQREKAASMLAARLQDLSGKRFGMLVVRARSSSPGERYVRWVCACDCGSETTVIGSNLSRGNTTSCGCTREHGRPVRSDEVRAMKNEIVKRRYRNDPKFAIDARVRAAVHKHLRSSGEIKSGRIYEALGYSRDALFARLLDTMPSGFSWSDFLAGGLQIDHIIPLSAFNFEKMSDLDFRRAWALSNLQLLPSRDNIKKETALTASFSRRSGSDVVMATCLNE